MINLQKDQKINLTKAGLRKVHFLIDWNTEEDVDIHCVVLQDGKAVDERDFIYFHNTKHHTGAVNHSGDIRNGKNVLGTADETITVDLDMLSKAMPSRNEVLFIVDIYDAMSRGVDFSDIKGAICKVVDADTGKVEVEYHLDTDLAGEICGLPARLTHDAAGWHFEALGKGAINLVSVLRGVGLNV
jgi:tellurium resistance protein TerD